MNTFKKTSRNTVKRAPKRGVYDRAEIYKVIDNEIICHVGFEVAGQPYVIPTLYGRDNDQLIMHGAKASRLIKHIAAGHPVSVAITQVTGLVLARAIFSHSINYQSVVIFGHGRLIADPEEKMRALEVLTDHFMPGRWADTRLPNKKEMNATSVVSVTIEEASAKIRTGPPKDDQEEDYSLPIWAGVLPIYRQAGPPQDDPRLTPGITPPAYIFAPGKDWQKPKDN